MIRVALLLVVVAASYAPVEEASISLLAGSYSFREIGARSEECQVVLRPTPVSKRDRELRPVAIAPVCRAKFSSLRYVTHWAATGGASVALFGGEPVAEIADFSPVQDGTGVYLRGGFEGDAAIYELRAPE